MCEDWEDGSEKKGSRVGFEEGENSFGNLGFQVLGYVYYYIVYEKVGDLKNFYNIKDKKLFRIRR